MGACAAPAVPTPPPALPPPAEPSPPPPPSPPPTSVVQPEVKELLVLHMEGWVSGIAYWVEGTVKNVGTVPLHDVQFEVAFYGKDDTLITTVSAPVQPSTIDVWKTAHCKVKMQQAKELKTFRYKFVLPSGESVPARFD